MYIIQVATEMAPVAKVGGLADVVYGLTRALERDGHAVEVILPKYDCMRYDQIHALTPIYNDLWVPWYGAAIHCTVLSGMVHGVKCLFIDAHSKDLFFNRGAYYGQNDEYMRWAFFSKAALEFMLKTNRRPDVIHCHDWQTGLLPVMLFEIYKYNGMWNQRVCYTIHSFKHQGQGPVEVLYATGLGRPWHYYTKDRLQDDFNPSVVNFMKGGIVFSNFVNTVSPHHAWEARHAGYGFGLGHTLSVHQNKFGGILNGIDPDQWNPASDRALPASYDSHKNYAHKADCKDFLRSRLWLEKNDRPIFAYVGRLDTQKGIHLIRHALFWSIANGGQFVLLGSAPERRINDYFWQLKCYLNDNPNCHLELGFDDGLARQIYAGADYMVVPSNFEPCGLTQLISLRYGTPPIVRYTGGLADTVEDWDYSNLPRQKRTGFVFHDENPEGIESALRRAMGLYKESPALYEQLSRQGMQQDFSWREPARHYEEIYEFIRNK
jgi:starch synthase